MRNVESIKGFIIGITLTIIMGWLEIGGIYHAFKHHSTSDGFIAVFIPPVAWYRSIEFFFCGNRIGIGRTYLENNNIRQSGNENWPDFNTMEASEMSAIMGKALQMSLDDSDIQEVSALLERYHKRVGRKMTEKEISLLTEFISISSAYRNELLVCLLSSFDSRREIVSEEFKSLCKTVVDRGYFQKSKIDADLRAISGEAYGKDWSDEEGILQSPLTRDEIELYKHSMNQQNSYSAKAE